MSWVRLLRRSLLAPRAHTRGLEEFYDTVTKVNQHPVTGRPWRTSELRQKSFSDLHKLWFVLLKERNMLLSQRAEVRSTKDPTAFPLPYRLKKVKLSMNRIKVVLGERQRIHAEAKHQIRLMYAKQKKERLKNEKMGNLSSFEKSAEQKSESDEEKKTEEQNEEQTAEKNIQQRHKNKNYSNSNF